MNSISEIAHILLQHDDFTIVTHEIPDGDGIGSALALFSVLKKLEKNAKVLCADHIPAIYHHLKGYQEIVSPGTMDGKVKNVIYLDCSDKKRTGILASILENHHLSINIDHHADNDFFAHYNYVDSRASATGEIIFDIIQEMNISLDPAAADALYTAIIMDTGAFQYGNTTAKTHRIAAQLMDMGADHDIARMALFESKDRAEMFLIKKALESMDFSEDGRVCWMSLSYADINSLGVAHLHPEGLINYARIIKGVEIGLLFREISPGLVKIGFRSRGNTDVAKIAAHFGGGGHRQAAGATQKGDIMVVRDQVLAYIKGVIG